MALYRTMGILLNRLVNTFRGVGRMGTSLLAVLAVPSAPDLRRQLRYLQAENAVQRSQLKGQVQVNPTQRSQRVQLGATCPSHWSGPDDNRTVRGRLGCHQS